MFPTLCDHMDYSMPDSLSFTISQSLLKLMSIESMMSCDYLILCCPLLLLPSIFPSIRVFSSESTFCIRWPKCWNFSFSISPSSEYSGLISFRKIFSLQFKGLSRVFSSTTVWKHQFFGAQPFLWSCLHICTWLLVLCEPGDSICCFWMLISSVLVHGLTYMCWYFLTEY